MRMIIGGDYNTPQAMAIKKPNKKTMEFNEVLLMMRGRISLKVVIYLRKEHQGNLLLSHLREPKTYFLLDRR